MTKRRSILFCGPIDKPGKSGRYIISGLEQLGYQVFGYDYRTNKNHEEDLLNLAEREKPFYFFTLKGEELSPELINRLKASGCITILWFEHYPLEDWMVALAKAHDFVVTKVLNNYTYRHQVERIMNWVDEHL